MSRNLSELNTTTNNYVYNRLYKQHLEATGKIRCSWCVFHGSNSENDSWEFYGQYSYQRPTSFPNWKLVSKNRKQWMKKPMKKVIHRRWWTKNQNEWTIKNLHEEWYSFKW